LVKHTGDYSSVLVSDISFVASSFQFYIYKHIHGCCNRVSRVLANMEGEVFLSINHTDGRNPNSCNSYGLRRYEIQHFIKKKLNNPIEKAKAP
jgi:hypothetical protein